ncbi:SDR family oxidoreductase [Tuwongella immobilis]|uniref:Uncharacterized protein n=1 Tax=Tuwongella immobilis TaxID=692036 RepID=A0A6C2YLN2_9BACT|nr:SDR family NAD(P)-dependent oxidoreductase [Tuwongella immobilis]VIP02336.1 short-chain dehydrogenase reductase sdr : Short-chain alcohol dehydrogenase OS=Singulisphaera acidiphila (strain ATCC BAA-1392 / DSM 18658 / VKM B-2454 / MOB10) GN=Sinac_0152 PE=3 SV=1: adh_short [Tuwongella immobilis]VTS01094.1 short-chain dehydrogenase reductase sdr : Short-chain alcohol dehydrogenase OS=Singulisphaera acidiphila (strain ATCC BAA-1392 / DSM 18658 / VKM B-2454 / MOB10) GN=Sinac_0152 PE=3 SV=1: adh_sho
MAEQTSRRVVITGATRGIGEALVHALIALGHTVIGCGRSSTAIATLQQRYPQPHQFTTLDVTDAAAVSQWANAAMDSLGVPDLLINNAAVLNRLAPLWEIPTEEFDHLIDVNVKGVANVLRAFLPRMVERRTGVIVNLSSGWGRSTSPEVAPYCASKYAIEGLTLALAEELPRGMVAVPLSPGTVNTDMLRSAWGSTAHASPSPEQWAAKAAPFLLKLGPRDNGRSLSIQG